MSVTAPNRIRRQVVDVVAFGAEDGIALRQRVEELCAGQLAPRLEAMLDSLPIAADEVVEIDRIEVNCEVTGELGESVVARIIEAIRVELRGRIESVGATPKTHVRRAVDSILEQVIHYLERGYLSWAASGGRVWQAEAETALRSVDAGYALRLRTVLRDARARARLVEQFDAECVWALAGRLCAGEVEATLLEDVRIAAQTLPRAMPESLEREALELVLSVVSAAVPASMDVVISKVAVMLAPTFAHETAATHVRSSSLRRAIEAAQTERGVRPPESESHPARTRPRRKSAAPTSSEGVQDEQPGDAGASEPSRRPSDPIYARNAGVVIVAPYFPALFRKLELERDGKILDSSLALVLIQYLVFGTVDCLEHEAVLSKILCGIPLEELVRTRVHLPETFRREADELLASVIQNWTILKNTSIEGLRASFLQREGALELSEVGWLLRMERKAFDVLLDHLPWTISMIRLPWMTETLRTTWA